VERARLLPVLPTVQDPRAAQGAPPAGGDLGLAVCAVLAGTWSFTVIAEWAADADQATPISVWPAMIRPDATPSGRSTGEHTATNRGRRARSKDDTPSHLPTAITTKPGHNSRQAAPAGATSGDHTQRPAQPRGRSITSVIAGRADQVLPSQVRFHPLVGVSLNGVPRADETPRPVCMLLAALPGAASHTWYESVRYHATSRDGMR
jgi:hypothetical protein